MSREVYIPPHLRTGNRAQQNSLLKTSREIYIPPHLRNQQHRQNQQHDSNAEDNDEDDMNDCAIEELQNSVFQLTMHVAQSFYGSLIGFKGQTKRRIETETRTEIYIPRNNEDENVVVKGKSRSNVCAARRQIKSLLQKRIKPTHFVEAPLNYGEVRENFVKFKQQILDANIAGIEDLFFTPEPLTCNDHCLCVTGRCETCKGQ